jgi:hypothetical protein
MSTGNYQTAGGPAHCKLEDLPTVINQSEADNEYCEYFEWSPKYLQMINDLESVIRSEKAKPNWERNKAAKARVKDYEKQLATLKALDDPAVTAHGEYRFNIRDNVEFKQQNTGPNTALTNMKERFLRVTRIENYT